MGSHQLRFGQYLFPEGQLPGLNDGRRITCLWLIDELSSALSADYRDVCRALNDLPENQVSMLDSPEGIESIATMVSMTLGCGPLCPIDIARH